MQPTWVSECGRVTLYNADCLEVLPTLEKGSVDAVVTDPPYGIRHRAGATTVWSPNQVKFAASWYGKQILGDDSTRVRDSALRLIGKVNAAVFADPTKPVISPRPKGKLIWSKRWFGMPRFGTAFRLRSYEEIWLIGKWRFAGVPLPAVLDGPPPPNSEARGRCHPHQKPVWLIETLVDRAACAGETIADPFMGSGTTGVACIRTGRRFIGIELDPHYFEVAKKRIQDELARHPLLEAVAS